MAVGIHFLFELLKISILSAVYGTIVFFIVRGVKRAEIKNTRQLWKKCFSTVYLILFVFMFTYWGDHGLGDDSKIPISHYKSVYQSDETAYIENKKGTQVEIGKFSYNDKYLYAEISDTAQIKGDYLVWDLQTDEWKPYPAKTYLALSETNQAVSSGIFKDFLYFYNGYWSGWRFWLLP